MSPVLPDHFRAVMSRFPTGVAVITAHGDDGPVGLTANAVSSLSLDPLLLLVCFDRGARSLPAIEARGHFGVNVLAAGQDALAIRFAGKQSFAEKFDGVAYSDVGGIPLLENVHARVGCSLERLLDGGDHLIGIGAVETAELGDGEPLVWHAGSFKALVEA